MKNITIVGGGTAGYVTALILKTRFHGFDINIIKSDKIGIVGVGEGTTEHWSVFMEYVGIDFKELLKETDGTCKGGVLFTDWTKGSEPYMHSIGGLVNMKNADEMIGYLELMANDCANHELIMPPIVENKFVLEFDKSRYNQYHFNTNKLNDFLDRKCKELGINVIIDEIKEVETDENGISKLIGDKEYTSDFYIDCTGFRKELISKLGAKWLSNGKYLKMKEAIAFPTDDTDDYPNYTLSQAMKYGWMWRIPAYGRWGNGYISTAIILMPTKRRKKLKKCLGMRLR